MDEGTLGVHEIELVVDAGEHLSDGGGVGDHADGALHLGEVAAWDDGRRLVVDTALEASRAPVDELDGALGLDGGDGGVDVLGDDVTAVHEAAGHVLAVAWVALGHHGRGLERSVGDLRDGELLVVCLLGGDDGRVGASTKWMRGYGTKLVWNSVTSTLSAPSKRSEAVRRDDLGDETVEVGVRRALNVESCDGRCHKWPRCRA